MDYCSFINSEHFISILPAANAMVEAMHDKMIRNLIFCKSLNLKKYRKIICLFEVGSLAKII